jgi:Protein of unknown function (DUF3309)
MASYFRGKVYGTGCYGGGGLGLVIVILLILSFRNSQNQLPALLMELIGWLAIATMKSLQCV